MLEIHSVSKSYRGTMVLSNLSFSVRDKTILGVFGPNGVGKTTLLKILGGLAFPDSGEISTDDNGVKPIISCLIEDPRFYPYMAGFDNLWLFYRLGGGKDKEKVLNSLQSVGLLQKKDVLYRHYSLGMKKRLYLAFALMRDSNLLLLDEPLNGLDPIAVEIIKEVVLHLKKKGCSIVISSHQLSDLQGLVDSAIFLDRGKIVFQSDEAQQIDLRSKYLEVVGHSGDAQ